MAYIPGQPLFAVATFQQINPLTGVAGAQYNPYEVIFTVAADRATPPIAPVRFRAGVDAAVQVTGTAYILSFTPTVEADWYVMADAYDVAGNHLGAQQAMLTVNPRAAAIPAP